MSDLKDEIKTRKEELKSMAEDVKEETKTQVEDQIEEGINRSRDVAEKVGSNLSKTVDNAIIVMKEMQKTWDEKVQDYKETGNVLIPIDLVNAKDFYYVQAAIPGVAKEDMEVEATENSITIKATYSNIFKNIESPEGSEPELVISGLKKGSAKRTIPFSNEIKKDEISAKYQDGILFLEIPKVEKDKTKVNIN